MSKNARDNELAAKERHLFYLQPPKKSTQLRHVFVVSLPTICICITDDEAAYHARRYFRETGKKDLAERENVNKTF